MKSFGIKNINNHKFTYLILIVFSIFALAPIYWVFNTSLKNEVSIVKYPPQWMPHPLTLDNYRNVLLDSPMPRYYFNSILLALITVVLVLLIGIHASYAASRYDFKGKGILLFILLTTIMIPGIVTLIPLYLMTVKMGIHDTYFALTLVYASWQVPTAVWLLRAFFDSVPRELEEAALIDGCTRISAFYRIVLPLAKPGIAAAAIIVFVYVWNEFMIALNLTASDAVRPLTVGLYFYIGETGILWGKMTAAAGIALIPIIVIYIILQKSLIRGLTAGAVKG